MAIIGYARVSTLEQKLEVQIAALKAAGCTSIHEEKASAKSGKARPVLKQLLRGIGRSDTLVVVRLDRLARSLPDLLNIIKQLQERGAGFRSLGDPVDTTGPQGMFMLQVMGAVAELERRLIVERTMAGVAHARSEGRVGGNPKLVRREPAALAALAVARDASYINSVMPMAEDLLPIVQNLRPAAAWGKVTMEVNRTLPAGTIPWTEGRLIRAVRRFVREGMAEPRLMGRQTGTPRGHEKNAEGAIHVLAGLRRANPNMSLRALGRKLEEMRVPTPRGHEAWAVGSVANVLKAVMSRGLLPQTNR